MFLLWMDPPPPLGKLLIIFCYQSYSCEHCGKDFTSKRKHQRHVLNVHFGWVAGKSLTLLIWFCNMYPVICTLSIVKCILYPGICTHGSFPGTTLYSAPSVTRAIETITISSRSTLLTANTSLYNTKNCPEHFYTTWKLCTLQSTAQHLQTIQNNEQHFKTVPNTKKHQHKLYQQTKQTKNYTQANTLIKTEKHNIMI